MRDANNSDPDNSIECTLRSDQDTSGQSLRDKLISLAAIAVIVWGATLAAYQGEAPTITMAESAPSECDRSLLGMCLVVPSNQQGGIFGFAEFVQAFALLALIYTLSGVRYRFRIATAPFPIWKITFWLSGIIGLGTLATDFWFAQQYLLPPIVASRALWQTAFGLLFMYLAMSWLWFAFFNPPVFGRRNSLKYISTLYGHLLQGADSDLSAIADELGRSAKSITEHARELRRRNRPQQEGECERRPPSADHAHDLLLLVGNRKFCRHVVASAPWTAIQFFQTMSELKKYRIPIGQFASNLSTEALVNRDSPLYHEDEGYYSGYLGYTRPFTSAIYGDFHLVEALAEQGHSPLDVDLDVRRKFDARQLEAYARAVLTTFASMLKSDAWSQHSYALYRAFEVIEHSCSDLFKLNDFPEHPDSGDIRDRLHAEVQFINRTIEVLEKHGVQPTILRGRGETYRRDVDYYDHIAKLMFETIFYASSVKRGDFVNWSIQHNAVWTAFFSIHVGKTRRIILYKLRRMLFEEIKELKELPNYRSAAIFGFCLNVMGLKVGSKQDHTRGEYQLRKAAISWARRNYLWLVQRHPKVAEASLMGTISFDAEKRCLVKTYEAGLSMVAPKEYLNLVEPPEQIESVDQGSENGVVH